MLFIIFVFHYCVYKQLLLSILAKYTNLTHNAYCILPLICTKCIYVFYE